MSEAEQNQWAPPIGPTETPEETVTPVIEPIGPPPGVNPSEFPVVEPGTLASPMQEAGGYSSIKTPSETERLEDERLIREAAGPSQTEQQ